MNDPWRGATIRQIYRRSFQDKVGDRDGEAVGGSIELRPNEGCAINVAAGVDIPASTD